MRNKRKNGFTLLEVMLVVVILAMLAAVAVPRLTASSEAAREKADITTGREVKSALDRYQVEKGLYPCLAELRAGDGEVTGPGFIPEYFKKLDSTVTQQTAPVDKKGFGIARIGQGNVYPDPQKLIMIYLTADGAAAEVKVFDKTLTKVLWSSI